MALTVSALWGSDLERTPPGAAVSETSVGSAPDELTTEVVRIPGTTVELELVRVAVGDGRSIWVQRTEVTWDQYDVFVYRLDEGGGKGGADASSRPSKPYVPPDRGLGHDGYPAMGMTLHAAREFCSWLSGKTGDRYRLATAAEWELLAGGPVDGVDGAAPVGDFAWTKENANFTTHRVGEKRANGFGLYDMLGNVAEWVETGEDERARPRPKPMAMGGSWRQGVAEARADATQRQASHWNASDPQIPKSVWWLADCSWVGFRVIREDEE